jgi:hypothetical protein
VKKKNGGKRNEKGSVQEEREKGRFFFFGFESTAMAF